MQVCYALCHVFRMLVTDVDMVFICVRSVGDMCLTLCSRVGSMVGNCVSLVVTCVGQQIMKIRFVMPNVQT